MAKVALRKIMAIDRRRTIELRGNFLFGKLWRFLDSLRMLVIAWLNLEKLVTRPSLFIVNLCLKNVVLRWLKCFIDRVAREAVLAARRHFEKALLKGAFSFCMNFWLFSRCLSSKDRVKVSAFTTRAYSFSWGSYRGLFWFFCCDLDVVKPIVAALVSDTFLLLCIRRLGNYYCLFAD